MENYIEKKKYKIIFSDIDGTLLNSKHQISKKTREKIQKLEKEGIPFIFVSARMPRGIKGFQKELASKNPIISYSGALILDGEGEVIYSAPLESEEARKIANRSREIYPTVSINPYSNDCWMTENKEEYWVAYESKVTGIIPKLVSLEEEAVWREVHKILCMGEASKIASLEQQLKKEFPNVQISKSKDTYLEILAKDVSKSKAADILVKYYGIEREESIAFGDSDNDIDMLEYAGLGVAMGNSYDGVKEHADYVTDTNVEEGVWEVLEFLF